MTSETITVDEIAAAIDRLNIFFDWSDANEAMLPFALEADAVLDEGLITVQQWEQAWMRAGKMERGL